MIAASHFARFHLPTRHTHSLRLARAARAPISQDGSLHINFSLSGGGRWADFVLKRLAPLLWADPVWRQRVSTGDVAEAYADVGASGGAAPAAAATTAPSAGSSSRGSNSAAHGHPARSHAARLLSSLQALVASLTPEDLLPDALLAGRLPAEGGAGGSADGGAADGSSGSGSGSGGANDDDDAGPAVEYAPLLLRAPPVADPRAPLPPPLTKAQRRAEAAAADAGAGTAYAAALQAWADSHGGGGAAVAPPDDVGLVRSPLAQFDLPPSLQALLPLPQATAAERLPTDGHPWGGLTTVAVIGGILGRSGTVGRGLDGASGGAQPDYRVELTVGNRLLPAVLAVARLRPGQATSLGALLTHTLEAYCRGADASGGASLGGNLDAHRAAAASLARLLCYTGALRLAA
jgi:hypothetical protein